MAYTVFERKSALINPLTTDFYANVANQIKVDLTQNDITETINSLILQCFDLGIDVPSGVEVVEEATDTVKDAINEGNKLILPKHKNWFPNILVSSDWTLIEENLNKYVFEYNGTGWDGNITWLPVGALTLCFYKALGEIVYNGLTVESVVGMLTDCNAQLKAIFI